MPEEVPHPRPLNGCADRDGSAHPARPQPQPTNHRRGSRLAGRAEAPMKIWLNVAEAAAYAGVSRDTIYTACERRELRHARIGGRRAIRLKPEWIDAWLERHARAAEDSPRRSSAPGPSYTSGASV